ncbi:MAG: hypothetical protein J0H88_01510 [Sphingomonadales bacterium]|nr:hypothetical protein [Sphingomonadales bacterium]
MKAINLAVAATLLSVIACAAPSTAADQLVLGDINWKATADGRKGEPRLRVSHRKSTSDVDLNGTRRELAGTTAVLAGRPGQVSFTIVHAAGTLACTGVLKQANDGEGSCSFTSDLAFETALAKRGLAPDQRSDLLAMLLVDATIELADGLTQEGVKPKDNGDLIAAAALEVTPAYIRDLKSEGLVLADIGDAVACKALSVDGAYVRGLASAGYRGLSAQDVVGMKAMGVSGEYALAINRARGSGQ